jgi:hypothetical protein
MVSHMNFRKIFILLPLICLPGIIVPQINKDELYKTIQFLASKDLAGRLARSEGYTIAADFISGELTKLNLKPTGDNKYFQKLKIEYNEILAPEHFSVIKNGIKTLYFVSTNSYKHLHQITDTPETINKDLLAAVTKLGYKTAQHITLTPSIPRSESH